ncbi:leishmanolysin-related zinc metalloendopeptidase [Deinococcus roseus]|uniref:Peptidase n=1 Tax=Deinococcus roseus TaxID=392414 RepID=A0ABQ2CZ27_9DEIO|nr:leishmanolysin-related zinc metalloendopeptidase [Deinococcus roseus]GGJ30886.1 hypothetical protein GCM10008938_16160 [Deinococcus roseus]
MKWNCLSVVLLLGFSSCGNSSLPVTGPQTQEPYNITLVFAGEPLLTSQEKAFFQQAAHRWEQVVAKGLPDVSGSIQVDDLLITVTAASMDGPGRIMSQSGPLLLRSGSNLPVTGMIHFDLDDLHIREQDGTLQNVILHEMGHVLGIGTIWNAYLNYDNASGCLQSSDIEFTGKHANQQFHQLGEAGFIPVENQYGAGNKCGHWDEETFKTELMTGFSTSNPMPLSKMTIGALEDLGYQVNYGVADTYALPRPEPAPQHHSFQPDQSSQPDQEIQELLTHPQVLQQDAGQQ